jgi:hypothetical protein
MPEEVDNAPVCDICGNVMHKGKVAVKLNRFCIKHLEGWYCPNSSNN